MSTNAIAMLCKSKNDQYDTTWGIAMLCFGLSFCLLYYDWGFIRFNLKSGSGKYFDDTILDLLTYSKKSDLGILLMFDDCIEAASSHAYWKSRMDKSPPDASLRNISIPKFSLHKNVVLYNNRFNITIIRSYPIRYSMTQDLRQSRS